MQARELVRKRYEDGMNAAQIATKLNINATSVRKRLQRIRDVLMKCLCTKLPELKADAP